MSIDDQLNHDLQVVGSKRVFFGHQSVGRNILDGIRDIRDATQNATINIVPIESARTCTGPFLAESNIGKNRQPKAKCDSFRRFVQEDGIGNSLNVALMKFCYVDIDAGTNIEEMFDYYKQTVAALRQSHPHLQLIHCTIPLVTSSPAWKRFIRKIIGREDQSDLAAYKRSQYNAMLLREFDTEPIFDLARIEATRRDGSHAGFEYQGNMVLSMADENTDDGGHLNARGRVAVARELLRILARTNSGDSR